MEAMERESIRVTRSVSVPVSEIELRVSRSSGPGGQHAQKSATRVEAVFDVEASEALTEAQRRRVVGRVGPVLRAVAQDERSQLRNRELAVERVVEKLRAALAAEVVEEPCAFDRQVLKHPGCVDHVHASILRRDSFSSGLKLPSDKLSLGQFAAEGCGRRVPQRRSVG
jgi:ribosome-associated protein